MTHEPYSLSSVMPGTPVGGKPRRVWLVVGLVAGFLVLIGATVGVTALLVSGGGFDVKGELTLTDKDAGWYGGAVACHGSGGYDDIRQGAQIVVSDAAGKTLAIGSLGQGTATGTTTCVFPVKVHVKSGGGDFYAVEVSHRGRVQYTADEIRQPLHLTLGN